MHIEIVRIRHTESWNYMQFNSIEFIFRFMPLFLAVYFIFPVKMRSGVLLVGSLYFYWRAVGSCWPVAVLLFFVGFSYGAGFSLCGRRKKLLLALYLSVFALALGFAKLYDGGEFLPAGMSFYLFQLAAYLIDVYRKRLQPQRSIIDFGSRIAMFPKLLSGPFVKPVQLHIETDGKIDQQGIHDGIQLLILGLGLKVILANRLRGLWAQAAVAGYENISSPAAWLALTAYAMQLYFDFFGYSLMAIGLGQMLGFDLPKNFDNPYASASVSEFYRHWHMTLGQWLREYVYIPLGGNRGGVLKTVLNLAVVWLFTGIWHGVGGNYLLWAGFLFLLIVNERLWLGAWLKKSRVICHVYVVFVILLSWLPFAVGDRNQMLTFLSRLFGAGLPAANPRDYLVWGRDYFGLLCAGVALATPLPEKLWKRIRHTFAADVLLVALFWGVIYYISTAAQDPFLYFRY